MRTSLATQEEHQPTKVTRFADPASWLSRRQRISVFLQAEIRHTAGEDSWTDDVDHDILGGEFRGLHFG
jgi:hypothetical protein